MSGSGTATDPLVLPDVNITASPPTAPTTTPTNPLVTPTDPTAVQPAVRRPQPVMKVNGVVTPGLLRFSAYSNGFFSADTWTAQIGIGNTGTGNLSAAYWAGQDDLELDLMVSLDGSPPQRVILGRSDRVQLDLEQQLIRISGRDYTGLLVDKKSSEKYPNLTSSQIVTQLAQAVGLSTTAPASAGPQPIILTKAQAALLTPQQAAAVLENNAAAGKASSGAPTSTVQATTTPAGVYYDSEHVRLNGTQSSEQSYWTLMTFLAQHEGMNLWVDGKTVYMQPPATPPGPNPFRLGYRYAGAGNTVPKSNQQHIVLERSLTLVRDVSVTVISWNYETGKAIKAMATSQKSPRPPHGGPVSTGTYIPTNGYKFNIPGLTKDQAMQIAQTRLADLTKHERRVAVENTPGRTRLTPRDYLVLTGTLTDFDQTYEIERIERTISKAGFFSSIWAKNSSPANTVTL